MFNILGPLLNPIRPAHQLVGVFSEELPPTFAEILQGLGREKAWAAHGKTDQGAAMDELSTLGPNLVWEAGSGSSPEKIDLPSMEELGLQIPAGLTELQGGDATENAQILVAVLDGTDQGPKRDLVLLNAGGALVVAGLAPDLPSGVALAKDQIDNGRATAKLEAMKA